ncbi:transporter substrate-binding domain-containing protein [Riemerella columbipharyngis]|uniref:Ligand-gated ion channel n=1 Tax=Riemerella columbipharyngis TaxID=1071918 RepID=A0A1G6YA33_9FLAO|nr:transporter substrate-binding domain-containing protein [Riemerella columbipharyngis]SDD87220.1 Ligand-gated ion channel [Riemerella columbipharyngis]
MFRPKKCFSKVFLYLLGMGFFLFFNSFNARSRDAKTVVIGVKVAPPFVEKKGSNFSGLSIDSWELVNKSLDWNYKFKEYKDVNSLLSAVRRGEVDFSINPITVTENRARHFSFTQPYFISNTVMARKKGFIVVTILKNLMTWSFISAVGALATIIFIFGFLIWIFERKKNKEQFGVGRWNGIGEGFWWSAVTMTTVGYGDKTPKTTMGRLIGIVWMFIAVISISSLTAGIASALTVQNLNEGISSIDDLSRFKVETVKNSSTGEFLDYYHIHYKAVNSLAQGVNDIDKDREQIFVYDEPLLYYQIDSLDKRDDIEILPHILRKDYFSYCFPKNSKLRNEVNPVLVSTLKDLRWLKLIKDYQAK